MSYLAVWTQMGQIRDFLDQVSVHFPLRTEIWSKKSRICLHFGPIWSTLDPNLHVWSDLLECLGQRPSPCWVQASRDDNTTPCMWGQDYLSIIQQQFRYAHNCSADAPGSFILRRRNIFQICSSDYQEFSCLFCSFAPIFSVAERWDRTCFTWYLLSWKLVGSEAK